MIVIKNNNAIIFGFGERIEDAILDYEKTSGFKFDESEFTIDVATEEELQQIENLAVGNGCSKCSCETPREFDWDKTECGYHGHNILWLDGQRVGYQCQTCGKEY